MNSNISKLLIIARGQTAAIGAFGSKSLSEVRKLTANATIINAIGVENGTNINNMPYLLYLPEVKIENGKIVSPDGIDVRLLLKRLTVGLTLDWTISQDMINKGYDLIEVRLMQVSKDYFILPTTEYEAPYGEMYPTSISEFVDGFRLKGNDLSSTGNNIRSQTLWLPANARGTRNDINSPNQRSKERAYDAVTYVEFVVDNAGKKERLYYRVYLGGNTTSDFNLKENTNYHWKVNINNANYTTDSRIQLLDQTPVESNNFIETSNSFMMRPGMNICFNPYKHEAGTDGWNTYLTTNGTSIDSDKAIDHVKVLWQTKDNGTSGNLVMGYVINENQHENLVMMSVDLPEPFTRLCSEVIVKVKANTKQPVGVERLWVNSVKMSKLSGDLFYQMGMTDWSINNSLEYTGSETFEKETFTNNIRGSGTNRPFTGHPGIYNS